ncbi:MAG TPA: alpha/beta hydrolase [Xanthomonadales bacterium]|nr:alpha/beta hydrolase [Xanthomonadales bacterium]
MSRATEHVVLVHGLWMRALAMGALGRRLRAAGYDVATFDYASVGLGPEPACERLRERIAKMKGRVHVVGHSLGGLVALESLRDVEAHEGHVVCLGSPLRGSGAARRLGLWPIGRSLVGRSLELLHAGVPPWHGRVPVGVVAGSAPYGLGQLLGGFAEPNDGTVAISETRLDGIADHVVVPSTHTGLIYNEAVARQAAHFLAHGRFAKD